MGEREVRTQDSKQELVRKPGPPHPISGAAPPRPPDSSPIPVHTRPSWLGFYHVLGASPETREKH